MLCDNIYGGKLVLVVCLIIILAIWSFIWKGIALWKAARKGSPVWFVILLITNTAGILDILYVYIFSNKRKRR